MRNSSTNNQIKCYVINTFGVALLWVELASYRGHLQEKSNWLTFQLFTISVP